MCLRPGLRVWPGGDQLALRYPVGSIAPRCFMDWPPRFRRGENHRARRHERSRGCGDADRRDRRAHGRVSRGSPSDIRGRDGHPRPDTAEGRDQPDDRCVQNIRKQSVARDRRGGNIEDAMIERRGGKPDLVGSISCEKVDCPCSRGEAGDRASRQFYIDGGRHRAGRRSHNSPPSEPLFDMTGLSRPSCTRVMLVKRTWVAPASNFGPTHATG